MIGPSVFGFVEPSETLEVFAELGVVFLLFWVGLETKLSDMREVGRPRRRWACRRGGPVRGRPRGRARLRREHRDQPVHRLGLAATSVGITSAVFAELGMLTTRAARTVLGAAVVDDILALLLVAVAVGVAAEGGVDVGSIAVAAGLAIGLRAIFALGGTA